MPTKPCILFLLLLGCHILLCRSQPVKRQASIDDLIHSALSLVRPIFDTSQAIQDSPVIPRKISMSDHVGRETQILGAPKFSSTMEIPICRGNSQICRFISCTAHNFKNDENFANLNLATQLLGDKKMRKVISSNPEAIGTVCREQGLSAEQCKLFSRSFQLIDNFMTNIEKPTNSVVTNTLSEPDDSELKPFDDDVNLHTNTPQQKQRVVNLAMPRNIQMGSQTWSTHQRPPSNPKSMKQVIRHSTTNRSQPLGLTEAPPHRQRRPPESPPRAISPVVHVKTSTNRRQVNYHTTERVHAKVPPRPKRLPELEEEEEEDDDFEYIEEENSSELARPRGKRSDNEYYDELDKANPTTVSSQKQQAAKQNCLQYLGSL